MDASNKGEHVWCAEIIGLDRTDALWPHFQMAEELRLRRIYGYPKDNALPPHLAQRLLEPAFAADVRACLLDDGLDALLWCVDRLILAAQPEPQS